MQPASSNKPESDLRFTDYDLHLFQEGRHFHLYEKLGAQVTQDGTHFAVWAPNAESVSVIGDFNGWRGGVHLLQPLRSSGVWAGFIPGMTGGALYKYHLRTREGSSLEKADPCGFLQEAPPRTASVTHAFRYTWGDGEWMRTRARANALDAPWSVYEVHLGSWRRGADNRLLGYRELAAPLVQYVRDMGFTHVEFMPLTEHPFYGSWGYQTTGYFAPSARYGGPQDLMYLIDALHCQGIGVIMDWVPSHFPNDPHGLARFDGTALYEHADPRQGFHPEWRSAVFNYGRTEVREFLVSSALFWFARYHADAIRVDGVASMLYLDYARPEGAWIPNEYGGRENLPAVHFLKVLNEEIYRQHPDVQTIAEESTAWPMVSRPTHSGGLGFGMKWNMGWMHDTLSYFSQDPVHRKYHQNALTFSMVYAYHENYMLPLSHDEVVHGKRSLVDRMPGDHWQRMANARLLLGYLYAHPGKKLLFMGGEFAQWREWNHDQSLDWHLLSHAPHEHMRLWVRSLCHFYRDTPALYEDDFSPDGFEWIDQSDHEQSVLVFLRKARTGALLLVAANFTPVPRHGYRVGVPIAGSWRECMNSDEARFGGSGAGNPEIREAAPAPMHGRPFSLELTLPPLAIVFLQPKSGPYAAG
ncbi:MAG: 1,4-alpha-glucan branching protein GlgB [Acidiferrobacteraceae bacterium]